MGIPDNSGDNAKNQEGQALLVGAGSNAKSAGDDARVGPTASTSREATAPNKEQGCSSPHAAKSSSGNADQLESQEPCVRKSPTLKQKLAVCYVATAFVLIFAPFNVAQTFLTTLFPSSGFYSFAVEYIMFAIGSLIAPAVGHVAGLVPSMVLGGFTYALMVSAFLTTSDPFLLLATAANGIGQGLLWIHEGLWIAKLTRDGEVDGYINGLFFFVFSFNAVVGNLVVIGSALADLSSFTLFSIMTAIAAAGAVMLIWTPRKAHKPSPPPPAPAHRDDAMLLADRHADTDHARVEEGLDKMSVKTTDTLPPSAHDMLVRTWAACKTRGAQLLAPYFAQQGVGQGFSFAVLPTLTPGSALDIGSMYLSYGVGSCILSIVCGRLFDRFGWRSVVTLHVLCTGLVYAWIFVVVYAGIDYRCHVFSAFLFAVVDTAANSINNMTVTELYSADPSPMFSLYRFLFCIAYAVTAVLASVTGFLPIALLALTSCFLSARAYAAMRYARLHPMAHHVSQSTL